jgi:hypothetical protein
MKLKVTWMFDPIIKENKDELDLDESDLEKVN